MNDDTPGPGSASDPSSAQRATAGRVDDRRTEEGFEHLQAAAREMISAARAFLDVAEELVADREKVAAVVGAVTSVADGVTRAVRVGVPRPDDPTEGSGHVQHIRVS